MSSANITAVHLSDEIGKVLLPATVVIAILVMFGFITNGIVAYIYTLKYPQVNFKYFVTTLTICNLIFIVLVMPSELYKQWNYLEYKQDWLCRSSAIFNAFAIFNTSAILFLVAVDRYLKISRPFEKISATLAKKFCVSVTLFCLVVSSAAGYFYGVRQYSLPYKGVNVTVHRCSLDKNDRVAYDAARALFVCFFVVTITPVTVLYVLFFIRILKISQRGQNNAEAGALQGKNESMCCNTLFGYILKFKSNKARKTIIMLLVTFSYILTMLIRMALAANTPKSEEIIQQLLNNEGAARRFISKTDFLYSILQPVIFAVLDKTFKERLGTCCGRQTKSHEERSPKGDPNSPSTIEQTLPATTAQHKINSCSPSYNSLSENTNHGRFTAEESTIDCTDLTPR